MKRLKEQMAQLQEAARERARQAEKDKVSTALLGLYWFIAPNNRHPTTIILMSLAMSSATGAENGGGKTNTVEERMMFKRNTTFTMLGKSKMYKSKIRHGTS